MATARVNDLNLYYEVHGAGEPLLLIFGFAGNTTNWGPLLPRLAQEYQVVAFDNRGAGRTDKPAYPYTMKMFAQDAAGLLDALGIDAAHVFGISMGGMIAQHVALDYPQKVISLILGCTTSGGPNAVGAAPDVRETFALLWTLPLEQAIERFLPIVYSDEFVAANKDMLIEQAMANATLRAPLEAIQSQAAAIQGQDTSQRLSEIRVPTLILHGKGDKLVPWENGKLLAERIPGAEALFLDKAGHEFFIEEAETTARAVVAFLKKQARKANVDSA